MLRALAVLLVSVAACGARTSLPEPDASTGGGGAGTSTSATGAPRNCAPNCTVGHRCCVGGCAGPAAVTENDCCVCLPGEVNSQTCPTHQCGS